MKKQVYKKPLMKVIHIAIQPLMLGLSNDAGLGSGGGSSNNPGGIIRARRRNSMDDWDSDNMEERNGIVW
jgi:hypothetical protein